MHDDITNEAASRIAAQTPRARWSAGLVAAVATATLALRIQLATADHGSVSGSVAHLSQFFTILTNSLVMLAMGWLSTGRRMPRSWFDPLVAAIIGVGIIYHLLLAHLWSPQGWSKAADQGVHTVVPGLTLLWWAFMARPTRPRWRSALYCAAWPLIYCVYALVRAHFSGFYPYPFLDLDTLGWGSLVKNILGLSTAFVVLGLTLVGAARIRFSLYAAAAETRIG